MTDADKPYLFISHKHRDTEIANAIRTFFEPYGAGKDLTVWQSSSFRAQAPTSGAVLLDTLKDSMAKAGLQIVAYTYRDLDWDFVMLEVGLAMDPGAPETRVVVLRCYDNELPSVFDGLLSVNATDQTSVVNFTKDFLTQPGYFSNRSDALTTLAREDAKVEEAGKQLFKVLHEVIPEPHEEGEWATVPFFRIELPIADAKAIRASQEDDDILSTRHMSSMTIIADENSAAYLLADIVRPVGMSLADLRGQKSANLGSLLARQVVLAVRRRTPTASDSVFDGGGASLLPVLGRFRSLASKRTMQFDIYFVPGAK